MSNLVIFKLGGSLLELPDLIPRLQIVLDQRRDRDVVIVVGGGAAANAVRDLDRNQNLDDERAHWLAIDAMERNARWLATRLPEAKLVSEPEQIRLRMAGVECSEPPVGRTLGARVRLEPSHPFSILLPAEFLRSVGSPSPLQPVPCSWDATSDSIAAWVAAFAGALELVMLKSTALPHQITVSDAATDGLVDAWFPRVAANLPRVSWCNLREPEPRIVAWHPSFAAGPT